MAVGLNVSERRELVGAAVGKAPPGLVNEPMSGQLRAAVVAIPIFAKGMGFVRELFPPTGQGRQVEPLVRIFAQGTEEQGAILFGQLRQLPLERFSMASICEVAKFLTTEHVIDLSTKHVIDKHVVSPEEKAAVLIQLARLDCSTVDRYRMERVIHFLCESLSESTEKLVDWMLGFPDLASAIPHLEREEWMLNSSLEQAERASEEAESLWSRENKWDKECWLEARWNEKCSMNKEWAELDEADPDVQGVTWGEGIRDNEPAPLVLPFSTEYPSTQGEYEGRGLVLIPRPYEVVMNGLELTEYRMTLVKLS